VRLSEFFQHNARPIVEGGNVFKDQPATGRIQQADVIPTVQWLETITGLPLADHMLGTTGKKSSSGDLDLAVDESTMSKDALVAKLRNAISQLGLPPTSVKKSGVSVHFRAPIRGTGEAGYVQTDFMFTDDLAWMRYMMSADPSSEFSGVHRAQLLASVAKAQGYKVTARGGLVDRSTDQTVSKDPTAIAEILFGSADAKTISSVENMMAALKNDPDREAKIADARDTFARAGLVLPENIQEDANDLFQMHPDTRTMGPQDKYRMHRPGVTIAASLLEAMDEDLDTTSNGYRKFGETQFFSIMVSLDGETALIVDHKQRARWKGENIGNAWEFTRNRVAGRREIFYVDELDDIMQMEEPESLIEKKKTISADEDPCWSGYHMVGTKKKGGREVPNCVPGKKGS